MAISEARSIDVVAYFYPFPLETTKNKQFTDSYTEYKNVITGVFENYPAEILPINMESGFDITIHDNYFNLHHLSAEGSALLFDYIDRYLIMKGVLTNE